MSIVISSDVHPQRYPVKEREPDDTTGDSSGINFTTGIARNANESTCKDLTTGSEDKVFNRPSHGAEALRLEVPD